MNPDQLARLSALELSERLRKSLREKDLAAARDAFVQIQSRFDRLCGTTEGSRRFLDDFLPLVGKAEVRALHVGDAPTQLVARLEHLLELAGIRARAVTEEAVLRQVVDSRDRGLDLLKALAAAPQQGFRASELAGQLRITPQNLSPLLSAFHAHGLVDRSKRGRHVYVALTRQGRALLPEAEAQPAAQPDIEPRFLRKPMIARKAWAA